MTWLFSLYWLGAFAVAGPILFHMWRRMPKGERPFSTLMFLSPSPPRLTSRSRIEHWLLLLLRAAALILLAFAFTRPLWRTPVTEPEHASDEQLLAILIDTSASLRREGMWEELLQRVDERVAQLPEKTFAALYRFDHQFHPVASFSELKSLEPGARRELVRSRLKELKPTWQDTQLGESLVQTATALQDAQADRSRMASQRIWLASDLQSGAEMIALQGYEWPDDLPVELISIAAKSPSNAGLQVVEKNLESGDDQLRVRISNAADSQKEQFKLFWDTPQSPELAVYVPPGQSRVVVPPTRPSGVTVSSLLLSGDDDDFDNRVYLAETLPESRMVIYCGDDAANDTAGTRFYLERAFAASHRFQIELKERRQVNAAAADAQPSLIVLADAHREDQPFVRQFLATGGTVVIVGVTPEGLAESLKLCGRDGLSVTEATVPKYAMLGDIDFAHTVFAPFADAQFSDFTGIRFWKHRQITGLHPVPADAGSAGDSAHDQVLARFDDGDPAIFEFPAERGRVIVFAAGWQPADSQFARSSKFPMLMFHLLEQSAGTSPRPGSQPVGSAIAWPVVNRAEVTATGSIRKPNGTEQTGLALNEPYTETDLPGIYTLSVPGRTEQIAVNLAANESRTTPLNTEQLEGFGLKLKGRKRPVDLQQQRERDRQLQLAELEETQKLWQWLLLGVIVLLVVETLATGWFSASTPEATGTTT